MSEQIERAISDFKYLRAMMTFDPNTGEELNIENDNENNKSLYYSAELAIHFLENQIKIADLARLGIQINMPFKYKDCDNWYCVTDDLHMNFYVYQEVEKPFWNKRLLQDSDFNEIDKKADWNSFLQQLNNKPLTHEQLKDMIGEPVWVECEEPHWIVIEKIHLAENCLNVLSTNSTWYTNIEAKFDVICQFEGIDNCTFYKHKPEKE